MTATPAPRCSIVIRAFNEEQHIGRLLTGITHQTLREMEIILVDSGSTDATVSIARQYPVQIIQIRPEDFTFGRSLNLGIAQAQSEIIVIASAHVYPVYADWLERLLAPFERPEVALTYGKQRGDPTTKFSEHQFFAQWFPEESQARQDHPFCNNANAAIRKSWWARHPYDEALTGLEDLAWARWALDEGGQIAYVAEAEIVHVHQEKPTQVLNRFRREGMAFKQIFPEARFNLWDFIRLAATNTLSDLWHAGREHELRANWQTILWFRLMQFWGTFQGYRTSGPVTNQLRQIFYYPRSLRTGSAPPPRRAEAIQYHDPREEQ